MSYHEHGFEVVRGLIQPQTLDYINHQIEIHRTVMSIQNGNMELLETIPFPSLEIHCINQYGLYLTEALLPLLHNKIEEVTNKKLLKTYSIFRVYKNGDHLPIHNDRNSCQISATLQLKSSSPWSLQDTVER